MVLSTNSIQHQDHGTAVTPMSWIGNCVVVVAELTLSRRAGTGTLSQVIIPYHSLEYPQSEGGKDQDRE